MAKSIEDVMERHEERLMEIPGVVGVGIGEHAGQPVLLVMLDQPASQLRDKVPDELEGFPVELEEIGEVTAF